MSVTMEKKWLRRLAKDLVARLKRGGSPSTLTVRSASSLRLEKSDTDGWYISVARVPGRNRGDMQVWLDAFLGGPRRRLSVCYKSTNADHIEALGRAGISQLGRPLRWTDRIYEKTKDEHFQLRHPPAPRCFQATDCRTVRSSTELALLHGLFPGAQIYKETCAREPPGHD
jgi:hypothetical protein